MACTVPAMVKMLFLQMLRKQQPTMDMLMVSVMVAMPKAKKKSAALQNTGNESLDMSSPVTKGAQLSM